MGNQRSHLREHKQWKKRLFRKKGNSEPRTSAPSYQPPLDVQQLWKDYKAGGSTNSYLRNQLIEIYVPLVKYNADRIHARLPEHIELDDLISAGVFGLIDTVEAFDLSRGVKFETYCVPRIIGAMLDELREMDWVPRSVRSKGTKLNELIRNLEPKLGRTPMYEDIHAELAKQLGSAKAADDMIAEATQIPGQISLTKKWYETDSYKDVREIDILTDKKAESPAKRLEDMDFMRTATKGLSKDERLIVLLYYYEEQTMKEIAAQLDLSESRVSQMHSSIIQRLGGDERIRERSGRTRAA